MGIAASGNQGPLQQEVAKIGRKKDLKKNEFLFLAEEPAEGFYYVLQGQIRVFRTNELGREIEIARFGAGDYLGEVILFAQQRFPVSAQAVVVSKVLYFSKEKILFEIRRRPDIAVFFLRLLAAKCQRLTQKIEALSLQSVRERLVRYLALHTPKEGRYLFQLPVKKTELAKELGTISETLSRTFRQLEKEGFIKVTGRTITVFDSARIR